MDYKPGVSKRIKDLANHFNMTKELDNLNKQKLIIKGGSGLKFNNDKTIPDSKEKIRDRIQVLLTANQFGQENVKEELKNLFNVL